MTIHDTYINRDIVNERWYKKPETNLVMFVLFMAVDENGQVVTTMRELEKETNFSKKTIISVLTLLENIEELETEEHENGQIRITVLRHNDYIRIGEFDDET